ncbi:534_t:CDS:1 [Paraglomus brasilianum]|uniref:534_t:CDS:1 n=1 Tax=Paraglomus brasilianum TaxID=144538 RepID=A0A9N9B9Z7_9GLOM|nr:534_t:CDS:1 [Paraglomus brasilianum]
MEVKDSTNTLNYTPPMTNIYVVDPPVDNNTGRRSGREAFFAFIAFMLIVAGIIMLALANTSMRRCIRDCELTFEFTDMTYEEELMCESSCVDSHTNQKDGGIALLVIGAVSLLADAAFVVYRHRGSNMRQ